MRSQKPYTNETFTKRVDHLAGAHRGKKAMPEPAVCEVCGDVYAERRWRKPDPERQSAKQKGFVPATQVVCPGCRRQSDGIASGYVHLEGAFLDEHQDEVKRLIRNETKRAGEDNPLARLIKWDKDKKGRLMVSTTTEHLAQRLGRALKKAYDGKVRYNFSHENKLAHVYWRRD